MFDEKHITKHTNCPKKYFTTPIVVTIKKEQSIKLAPDSIKLNKAICKNKYQMPNNDTLIESISQQNSDLASQSRRYILTIYLKYAYKQKKLYLDAAKFCNCILISCNLTDTYRF